MADREKYQEQLQRWREFGRIGRAPTPPTPPQHLALWFELKRWPGHLLVEGGLLDQPAFTWELVDLAGLIFEGAMGEHAG